MDLNNLFERLSEETFWEIINNEGRKLSENHKEWKKYSKICSKALENHKLQNILEDCVATAITEEECKDLIEYHQADIERQVIENKEMFKAGIRFAYYFFNKVELIKNDESDLSA